MILSGCATPVQTAGAVIGGTTLLGAQTPSDEIEQIYYLGVFDPQEQLPPSIYRVTVRGQSSFLNQSKFASGWVPAQLIDSLSSKASEDGIGSTDFTNGRPGGATDPQDRLKTGRRLVTFGPEGFREAPKDHRLVIVMGADPSAYFEAIDLALGDMGGVKVQQANQGMLKQLTDAYSRSENQDRKLELLLKTARASLNPTAQ